MKLIKKIAAIMFAFMMVVSMSCNVKAAGTGKITIVVLQILMKSIRFIKF